MTERDYYLDWLMGLDDDEFDNERYTVKNEWEKIGMSEAECIDKSNALDVAAHRRSMR